MVGNWRLWLHLLARDGTNFKLLVRACAQRTFRFRLGRKGGIWLECCAVSALLGMLSLVEFLEVVDTREVGRVERRLLCYGTYST